LPAVRGELLTRLGRVEEARTELGRAVELCANAREREVLERKRNALG
jgi:predicted RNA polymerase sigma factor